jgi:hypothetical protein
MRISTAEIVVNGRRKIVNADDPRVKEATNAEAQALREEGRKEAVKPAPRRRARKKAD